MARSLSNLVNNLAEEIHKIKCKHRHDDKRSKPAELNKNIAPVFLKYTNFKADVVEHNFLIQIHFLTMISISLFYCCQKMFIHMNTWMIWKNLMKQISLPETEDFYSNLSSIVIEGASTLFLFLSVF